MTEATVVVIDDITIKQDKEGRYCLNDLHKAAGETPHHQPAKYFATQDAQGLISEIGELAVVSKRGRYGGTYAVKELVYAYAMWISPTFHLKVIRAYDRLATQGVAVHENAADDLLKNPLKYMRALLGQDKQLQEERAAVW